MVQTVPPWSRFCRPEMPTDDPSWTAYRVAVGERLRSARLDANLTQDRLAEQAAVSRNFVQRVERGDALSPGLAAVYRLARAVQVPMSDLLADGA